jgi:hypothetical protein
LAATDRESLASVSGLTRWEDLKRDSPARESRVDLGIDETPRSHVRFELLRLGGVARTGLQARGRRYSEGRTKVSGMSP